MAKRRYRKGRNFYNVEETVEKKNANISKGAKTKVKKDKGSEFGSGRIGSKNGSNMPKKNKRLPDIKRLEKDVLQCIIGQDKQVRQIITAIYRAMNFKTIKSNVLIIGNSGTGKTETIEQIAKRLHMPYTIEDATKYTKEGYYGADVNDMIYNLFENAHRDFERAQHGIIIIDEIDKKAGHQENDVAGVEVLKSLLKIIEGTRIKIPSPDDPFGEEMIDFDTKDITVIFLGAFSGLDKIRDKRLNTNPLGFSTNAKEEQDGQKSKFLKH